MTRCLQSCVQSKLSDPASLQTLIYSCSCGRAHPESVCLCPLLSNFVAVRRCSISACRRVLFTRVSRHRTPREQAKSLVLVLLWRVARAMRNQGGQAVPLRCCATALPGHARHSSTPKACSLIATHATGIDPQLQKSPRVCSCANAHLSVALHAVCRLSPMQERLHRHKYATCSVILMVYHSLTHDAHTRRLSMFHEHEHALDAYACTCHVTCACAHWSMAPSPLHKGYPHPLSL